jgi:hypothetical protein
MYDQIIIGAGASAIVFAAATTGDKHADVKFREYDLVKDVGKPGETVQFNQQKRIAVGGQHLWQLPKPESKAGQPGHLHQFPGTPAKDYTTPLPTKEISSFRTSAELRDELEHVKTNVAKLAVELGQVRQVKESASGRSVEVHLFNRQEPLLAKQVIVCSGPGPERLPETDLFEGGVEGLKKLRYTKGDENSDAHLIFTALEFLPPDIKFKPEMNVLVYGGAATAAWVVEKILDIGCRVIWLARPSSEERKKDNPFLDANPAGRNQRVMDLMSESRCIGTMQKIKADRSKQGKQVLRVEFSALKLQHSGYTFSPGFAWCWDKMVCAIGTDVKQPGSALSITHGITLHPFWDVDRVFADWTNQEHGSILALRNRTGTVWVVGASVAKNFLTTKADKDYFKALGLDADAFDIDSPGKYSDLGCTLPPGNRLVEVIGEVTASIEAVTNYMPDDIAERVNYNTANRTQLAVFLAAHREYGNLHEQSRNLIVRRILEARTQEDHAFGLTVEEVKKIIADVKQTGEGLTMRGGKEYLVSVREPTKAAVELKPLIGERLVKKPKTAKST